MSRVVDETAICPVDGHLLLRSLLHVDCAADPHVVAATCVYGDEFAAALERDNVMATQFHPEKSQDDGLALLRRFAAWQPTAVAA